MKKNSLSIGSSQILNSIDVAQNLETILTSIKTHQTNGCDIALFPECALTGFTGKVKNTDFSKVSAACEKIQEQIDQGSMTALVPSAWKTEDGKFLNAGFYFQPKHPLQQVFKEGLTESEEKFFTAGKNHSRILEVKGYRLAFLICIEAAHEPWTYLDPAHLPDAILWPGYWGKDRDAIWDESLTGDSLKIFQNNRVWKTPIIQATFFDNCADDKLGEGPFGRSVAISGQNQLTHVAARRSAEDFKVVIKQ